MAQILRRRLHLLALAIAALGGYTGCAFPEADPEALRDAPLTAQGFIVGGFVAAPSPVHGKAGTGAFLKLRHPAALAANGPDLYVADVGQRLLLRVDTVTQGFTPLRELPPLPGVRLETDRDGSVYVVRPDSPDVERIARNGRLLATMGAQFEILRPADVAIARDGKIWISDTAGSVFAFHPSGRVAEPLVGQGRGFGNELEAATWLARSSSGVIGIDPRCRCAIAFDREGIPLGRFAEAELLDPIDLVVDIHDRVWILDRGDQTLKIFERWQLVRKLTAFQLGLSEISGIAFDASRVYLSDGPGGKIGIFALLPPPLK